MSINPVQSGGPSVPDLADLHTGPIPGGVAAGKREVPAPDSGPSQKQTPAPPSVPDSSISTPEDEVQVQRQNGFNGEIVIRYLDGHGDVILQVPSSQVLDLERSIEQDLGADAGPGNGAESASLRRKGEKAGGN